MVPGHWLLPSLWLKGAHVWVAQGSFFSLAANSLELSANIILMEFQYSLFNGPCCLVPLPPENLVFPHLPGILTSGLGNASVGISESSETRRPRLSSLVGMCVLMSLLISPTSGVA